MNETTTWYDDMSDAAMDRLRIVRPGWSGCLVPAGKHRGDGVRIEPFALDGSPAAPDDHDKWLTALTKTFQWRAAAERTPPCP